MRITRTSAGLALGFAATMFLAACGAQSNPAAGNDAMMSSASNEAMMSSEGNDAMMSSESGSAMSSDDAMSSGNAMAVNDQMSSGDAMSKGGNESMAADAPRQ